MSIKSIFLFWISIGIVGAYAQSSRQMSESFSFYPFNNQYINLENLTYLSGVSLDDKNFKTSNKYAYRFKGFNREKSIPLPQGAVLTLDEHHNAYFTPTQGKKYLLVAKNDYITLESASFLILDTEGLLIQKFGSANDAFYHKFKGLSEEQYLKKKDEYGFNQYIFTRFDAEGKIKWQKNLTHTKVDIKGNEHHYKPYLGYFDRSLHQLVFTSGWFGKNIPHSHILDVYTGEIQSQPMILSGIIRDTLEEKVIGYLIQNDDKKLNITYQKQNFVLPNPYYSSSHTFETLIKDNILVVAVYHPIATGSYLFAIDLSTKKLLWEADVMQINACHSEYSNTVYLGLYKDKIILEGDEEGGDYVQIFDLQTGKRLFSTLFR